MKVKTQIADQAKTREELLREADEIRVALDSSPSKDEKNTLLRLLARVLEEIRR